MTRQTYPKWWVAMLCIFAPNLLLTAQSKREQIEQAKVRILSDKKIESVEFSPERATPSFVNLKTVADGYSSQQASVVLDNVLNARPSTDFLKMDREVKLDASNQVIEFQQYFKGVKVDRAKFKAFSKNGSLKFLNGSFYSVPADLSTQPAVAEKQAIEIAKRSLGVKKMAADEYAEAIAKSNDEKVKAELKEAMLDASPNGELVIMQDFSKPHAAEVRLAYKFNIYATQPLNRSYVYVDAQDGHILLVDPIIKHFDKQKTPPPASVITNVQTRYAGTRSIYVKQISGNDPNNGLPLVSSHPTSEPTYVAGDPTYVLMDDTRGGGVETYDLNAVGGLPISVAPAYTFAKSFTDLDNNWTLTEHKRGVGNGVAAELENDDIAWDAHWGAEVVYDYWKARHNRLSFDGKNGKIKSYIHSGAGYDNAFWNGTVMTYGDGSYPAPGGFKALTSLDVCGHEIGHGVCSSTSDLVYANESGAMNEGLSDIWASCIEYYAIKNIDPSLAAVYKPFYIGEQISADPTQPLRRMDSPKAASNPDTYGGENWTEQPGCTPTLANDECGVHNNSGVINKWFYLITVGSGTGSGPDAAFAGADDGINDAVAGVHAAQPYSVKGLGFALSEKITFLMETMLSSTATYDEARRVSIAAATQISGDPCSAMVETVTNAWYAVGVGDAFVKPCTVTYGFVTNNAALTTTETGTTAGCNSVRTVTIPVIIPSRSTATFTTSGTATKTIDYTMAYTTLTNTSSAARKYNQTVRILNDAAVENDETIVINVALTNTGANPVNDTYTITIMDDDVVPVISNGQKTLLSETFTRADGFNELSGWTETLELPETSGTLGTGKNQWGIFDNRLAITGREGTTNTKLPNRTYNDVSESRTIVKAPVIDARGLSNIRLKFDYTAQGEVDPTGVDIENFPALDYIAVVYSFDGVKYQELNTGGLRQFASLLGDSGTVDVTLPASFDNKLFYLGFRWNNDANAGGPVSGSIDNLLVQASGRQIENDRGKYTRQNLQSLSDVYFISDQDNEVIAKVKNNSTPNLGCTFVYVERAGDAAFNLYKEGTAYHKAAGKVIKITPTASTSVSKTVTLFYTEAQIAALETATGKNRMNFAIYQIDSSSYGLARPTNTKSYAATYEAIPGVGGMFSSTIVGKATGSYALGAYMGTTGARESAPIVSRQVMITDVSVESLYPNPSKGGAQYGITSAAEQRVRVEIMTVTGQLVSSQSTRLVRGYNNMKVQSEQLAPGNYFIYLKNENGEVINRQKFIKQ